MIKGRKTTKALIMKTTISLLDALKTRHSINSDYAISKVLGVTRQTVSNYRHNRQSFDDKIAVYIAEQLSLDPMCILACMRKERAQRANNLEDIIFWDKYSCPKKSDKLTPA
jgi:hypothetical protein